MVIQNDSDTLEISLVLPHIDKQKYYQTQCIVENFALHKEKLAFALSFWDIIYILPDSSVCLGRAAGHPRYQGGAGHIRQP